MLKKEKLLNSDFFAKTTLKVAKNLLGKVLVRQIGNKIYKYRIVETEAYCGKKDLACHTSKGKTQRNQIMFGPPGRIYVYLIYGMYYCLNFVTSNIGNGEAVLIRALEPLDKNNQKTNGPGKLCRELKIDKKLNGLKLSRQNNLWIEDDDFTIKPLDIAVSPRRGVNYAKHCADYPWRFYLKDSNFVS